MTQTAILLAKGARRPEGRIEAGRARARADKVRYLQFPRLGRKIPRGELRGSAVEYRRL